jgi:molecular chaperone HscB
MFRKLLLTPSFQIYSYKQYLTYNCWSCKRLLLDKEKKAFFCPTPCNAILPVNPTINYFELFNIDLNYNINATKITKKFRELMRKLHPDLFTLKTEVYFN